MSADLPSKDEGLYDELNINIAEIAKFFKKEIEEKELKK